MKKPEKKVEVEKQEKETTMRFDRAWIQPLGKRGVVKLMAKVAKNLPLIRTEREQEQYDVKMAPKRLRRQKHREAKRLEAKMLLVKNKVEANVATA